MPIELVSAVESSRLLQERLLAQRLGRTRVEEAAREQERIEGERASKARADAVFAERERLETLQQARQERARLAAERFEDRVEAANAERARGASSSSQREVERLLAERARADGLEFYRSQSEPPPRMYVLDAVQAERVQSVRQAIERADVMRLDRIDFSDAALSQMPYGY